MQLFSGNSTILKNPPKKRISFFTSENTRKTAIKSSRLMAVWIFFSAATTAQNTPEFILEMWLKIPLSATLVLTHLINSSFYHLFLLFSLFMSEFVFPIFAKIVYQKVVFEIRAINIKQTIQFLPMHPTRKF
jgi:hypothetical protein